MLVLSRQRDETIMFGDDIEITVVDIRGEKVRLGINAPPHIAVHRKEVYEAIQSENRAASRVSVNDVSILEHIIRRPVPGEIARPNSQPAHLAPGAAPSSDALANGHGAF